MYRITDINGNIIAQLSDIRYVKRKTQSFHDTEYSYWVRCNAADAQCVAINGIRYSLAGRDIVEDAPTVVFIYEVDAAEELLNTYNDLTDAQLAIADLFEQSDNDITQLQLAITQLYEQSLKE